MMAFHGFGWHGPDTSRLAMTARIPGTILLLLAVALTALLAFGCGKDGNSTSTSKGTPTAGPAMTEANNPPQRFILNDLFGRKRRWSEFVGNPLVINFWATWCGPCRYEMPVLKKLYAEYKPKGLEIVGISVDRTLDPVTPFVYQMQIPWVIVLGDSRVVDEFKLGRGIPMTIFFDAAGKEIGRVTGAQPEAVFRDYFDRLVASPPKS